MGRKGEFVLVEAIVRQILLNTMKSQVATRQVLMHHITNEFKVSERAFAKALALIADSGILIKRNVPVILNEVNARGERRKDSRTGLFINFLEALKRLSEIWTVEFERSITNLPEDAKKYLVSRMHVLKYNQLTEEFDIAESMLKKFGSGDSQTMSPGEKFLWNVESSRVMNYLEALRDKDRTTSKDYENKNLILDHNE